MVERISSFLAILRVPEEKRTELRELRRRWHRVSRKQKGISTQERAAQQAQAQSMRALRVNITKQLGQVHACTACGKGCPLPQGQWDGGFCCGGHTHEIFSDQEIAALQMAGTRFRDLVPPQSQQAGCLFRGATGCSLSPQHRPNQCLTYVCRDLSKELAKRPDASTLKETHLALEAARNHFVMALGESLHDESD